MAQTPEQFDYGQEGKKAPRATLGDRVFERATYGGLNGFGTFLLTIPLAFWADHGGGKPAFDALSARLVKTFNFSEKSSLAMVKTTALGIGGTVMVAPVYVAEKFRKPIVNWINARWGSKADHAETAQHPPPQTVGSLLKGRVVAWLAVFSGFKAFEYASKLLGAPDALQNFEHQVGEATCKTLGKPLLDGAGLPSRTYRYGRIAALDVFATTAAASIFYLSSKAFARKSEAHKQSRLEVTGTPLTTHTPKTEPIQLPTDSQTPDTQVTQAALAEQRVAAPSAQEMVIG